MATPVGTGTLGHLTHDQEYKLKEQWLTVYTIFGIVPDGTKVGGKAPEPEKKSGRFGFGSKTVSSESVLSEAIEAFRTATSGFSQTRLHEKFCDLSRADHPDQFMLRFLRARKWDVPRAVEMFGKTLKWRTEFDIEDIMKKGEIYWMTTDPDEGFINQYKTGKAILQGKDKENRPVITIQVKKHDPRAQSEEAMRRYVLFHMENSRLCLDDEIETAGVIFDLGGFGLHNMDYAVVKFLIDCFEAHYPESLAYLYIRRAPWIFSSVWNVIKGLIDPVVAAKISFTKNEKDLFKKIESDSLPPDLGGTMEDEYHWIEPTEAENAPMKDTETLEQLQTERKKIFHEFEQVTLEWIKADGEASTKLYEKRNEVVTRLKESYWQVDPYTRARSIYDRNGRLGMFRSELAPGGISQPVLK